MANLGTVQREVQIVAATNTRDEARAFEKLREETLQTAEASTTDALATA